jgi:hypothetical protein
VLPFSSARSLAAPSSSCVFSVGLMFRPGAMALLCRFVVCCAFNTCGVDGELRAADRGLVHAHTLSLTTHGHDMRRIRSECSVLGGLQASYDTDGWGEDSMHVWTCATGRCRARLAGRN